MWNHWKSNLLGALFVASLAFVTPARACGPYFPNQLLLMGDEAVLEAPVADFRLEIDRIKPSGKPRFVAQEREFTHPNQSYDADLYDFHAAAEQQGLSDEVQRQYSEVRDAIRAYLEERDHWKDSWRYEQRGGEFVRVHEGNEPHLPALATPEGLPGEFADYLTGAIAYHRGQLDTARDQWNRLLDRPKDQRRYRSTWAAFMIGKSYLGSDPTKAIAAFQRVRELAQDGFTDTLGLAASSIGWEAKAELDQGHTVRAIELYFDQYATGDLSALTSMDFVVGRIFQADSPDLRPLAQSRIARSVITAWLISRRFKPDVSLDLWLGAVEHADVVDVDGADRLAWAAYQSSDDEAAWRWLGRARGKSPVALWVKAKLLLRDGRMSEAGALLTKLIHSFPDDEDWLEASKPEGSRWFCSTAPNEIRGELGVLTLARGQYTDALDLLLRAGYWTDAAYVAERVLTPEELVAYVRREWMRPVAVKEDDSVLADDGCGTTDSRVPEQIRYLTARRLARLGRFEDAKPFFPPAMKTTFDAYVEAMKRGRDAGLPSVDRAEWLWEAAKITRFKGFDLTATEVDPDWKVWDGGFDLGSVSGSRPEDAKLVPVTRDEQERAARSAAEPSMRFHYRYVAADLAWEAAQLLPDDSDATATVLCEAGSWLKNRDPQAADRFYKALVNRCRHTELGSAADRQRWFPRIEEPEPPESVP